MRRRPPLPAQARRRHARGAIGVLGALWIGVAATCLMAIDIGHVFWQQREVQRIADLAALAGASAEAAQCADHARDNASRNGARPADTLTVECGLWDPRSENAGPSAGGAVQYFQVGRQPFNAARVRVERRVPYFFVFASGSAARTVSARGTGARARPRAALTIRSTLVAVDGGMLNAVLGSLLGGSIAVSAAGWQGLVDSQIRLLDYIDQLGVNLGIGAGQVDRVLATDMRLNELLQGAIDVLRRQSTSRPAADAVAALQALQGLAGSGTVLRLGDLLTVAGRTPSSALQADIQAFQLAQMLAQLANRRSALTADVPLATIPGLASVRLRTRVIEAPQFAIGDPERARLQPLGPDGIQVRTAQVRTLLTADAPALAVVPGLLAAVGNLLAPVTGLLNSVLRLDLGAVLCVVSCTTTETRAVPVPVTANLSVHLEVAQAEAHVTDVDCRSASRALTAQATTAAASLRIGSMTAAQQTAAIASSAPPAMTPIPVLDLETRKCTKTLLGLVWSCDAWAPYSRTGLSAAAQVASTATVARWNDPPEIGRPPAFQTFSTTQIAASLRSTLTGVQLQTYRYNTAAPNALGEAIGSATQLVGSAAVAVRSLVDALLAPLLDRLVAVLQTALGIDLGQVGVGANLSCGKDVELVH